MLLNIKSAVNSKSNSLKTRSFPIHILIRQFPDLGISLYMTPINYLNRRRSFKLKFQFLLLHRTILMRFSKQKRINDSALIYIEIVTFFVSFRRTTMMRCSNSLKATDSTRLWPSCSQATRASHASTRWAVTQNSQMISTARAPRKLRIMCFLFDMCSYLFFVLK